MNTFSLSNRFAKTFCLMSTLLLALPLLAQQGRQNGSPRGEMMSRFSQAAPEIGQKLPRLEAFDSKGNPWNTDQLKGKYTVLVFGCLT